MTDDTDIEELKEEHQKGSRISAAADETDTDTRHDQLVSQFKAVRSGETSKTLSFRDEFAAGLLRAVEADDDLEAELAGALQEALAEDATTASDRSEILRQAVRVGLREAAPELVDDGKTAYAEAVTDDI
jgi:hypothetical protein